MKKIVDGLTVRPQQSPSLLALDIRPGQGGHGLHCSWCWPLQTFPIDFQIFHWKCLLQKENVLAPSRVKSRPASKKTLLGSNPLAITFCCNNITGPMGILQQLIIFITHLLLVLYSGWLKHRLGDELIQASDRARVFCGNSTRAGNSL